MSAPATRTNRPTASGRPAPVQSTRQQLDDLDALLQRMLDLPVSQQESAEDDVREDFAEPEPEATPIPPARPTRPERVLSEPRPPARRSYPPSYMVVETSNPPIPDRADPPYASGHEPRPIEEPRDALFEAPTPGGRHDLNADNDADPIGDLARLRARLENTEGDWVPLRSSWQPSAQTWKPLAETWQQTQAPAESPQEQQPEVPAWTPEREDRLPASELPDAFIPPAPAVAPRQTPQPSAARTPLVWFNQTFDACLLPLGPAAGWLKRPSGRNFLAVVGLLCLMAAGALVAAQWSGFEGLEGLGWTR